MDVCEFCDKEADVEGTSMTGLYCIDCLRLVRSECLTAIKKLQHRANSRHTPRNIKQTTKEQYDNALNELKRGL